MAKKYFIHLCYNGDRLECIDRYQVTRKQYLNWEWLFGMDCFDELETKKADHLFLDAGDCDDPVEITYLHDMRAIV